MYCGGYVYLRYYHRIVHYSVFAADCYSEHRVESGDTKAFAIVNAYAVFFYFPLRGIENMFWNLYEPLGSPRRADTTAA